MKVLPQGHYTGSVTRKRDIGGAIVSTSYSDQTSSTDWHSHENLHFCFVYEGRSETKRSTTWASGEGEVFFYRAGEIHRWIPPQRISRNANVEISPEFLFRNGLCESDVETAINNKAIALPLILRMQKELWLDHSEDNSSLQLLLLELLTHSSNSKAGRPGWVMQLETILQDNWNMNLTLSAIAEAVGVHPVTISKSFRLYFGGTLSEYRRRLRVSRAILLIKESTKSLSEIAVHCGFSDQSHFIRAFKSETGFLPRNFRQF